jgi:hypothetical protein
MNTNNEKLWLKAEVFQIVGCAIEVLNTLAEDSFPTATLVRRFLQRPQDWPFRS